MTEEEFDSKLKDKSILVAKKIDDIIYNNFDVSCKESNDTIQSIFVKLETSRNYSKKLSNIKKIRKNLLGKLNLDEYTTLLQQHIKMLTSIFTTKNYSSTKIHKFIVASLEPLDMRLLYYNGYSNTTIEFDDIQKFGLALSILVQHKQSFIPFTKSIFYKNIKNYGLALFDLSKCIENCLINRYGYHNIIYLQLPTKSANPFSFYTLDNIKDNHRCWNLECRLLDFTVDFIDNVKPYCISLFRKIYFDIYNDNIFRSNYTTTSQITEFDCEQLLQNIILLSLPIRLNTIFKNMIIQHCTSKSTVNDKYNLRQDDKLQSKKSSLDSNDILIENIKLLFDNINDSDLEYFIKKV